MNTSTETSYYEMEDSDPAHTYTPLTDRQPNTYHALEIHQPEGRISLAEGKTGKIGYMQSGDRLAATCDALDLTERETENYVPLGVRAPTTYDALGITEGEPDNYTSLGDRAPTLFDALGITEGGPENYTSLGDRAPTTYDDLEITEGGPENYTSLGDRAPTTYDDLEITEGGPENYTSLGDRAPDTYDDTTNQAGHGTSSRKKVFLGTLVAVVLVVIGVSVTGFLFVGKEEKTHTTERLRGDGHCPKYIHIANSEVVHATGFSHGDVIEIKCDARTNLVGSSLITCLSSGKWNTTNTACVQYSNASDCYDIVRANPLYKSGTFIVQLWKSKEEIQVSCDMETDHGGWTVFQYRFDGSIEFYRKFSEYERGFGNLKTEFWLGLSYIQEIASQGENDLRIDLESANGTRAYETFSNFYLSLGPDYVLHVGPTIDSSKISRDYSFGPYHSGMKLSTYDRELDPNPDCNCAHRYHGAWWYNSCYNANLNGIFMAPGAEDDTAMVYRSFLDYQSLKSSKMMMRRKLK